MGREPSGVEIAPRLERLEPARLALDLAVRAVEQVRDEGADFGAEGGFGCGEGGLGKELVVLGVRGQRGLSVRDVAERERRA